MNLYLDNVPVKGDLFKLAAFAARVSDKPENWPQELTSEIMRQLPYLSDYDLNVNLQTVDPQRGFAFGYGDVSSKSERPEVEHAETGIPHIRIPLIIQDRAVKPFNVFLDGERVVPLTEERVRQTLFNPQSFDLSSSSPRDPSLVEALMPPTRTGPGMGGEYKMASVTKEAFAHMTAEQWKALYQNDKIKKLVEKHGPKHTEVDNAVYELAAKIYGYHPKIASVQKEAMQPATIAKAVMTSSFGPKAATAVQRGQRVLGKMEGRVQKATETQGRAAGIQALQNKLPVSEAVQNIQMPGRQPTRAQAPTQIIPQGRGTAVRNIEPTQAMLAPQQPTVVARPPNAFPNAMPGGSSMAPQTAPPVTGGRRMTFRPKLAHILSEISHTIRKEDADRFVEKIASDPNIIAGLRRSGAGREIAEIFDAINSQSSEDVLYKVAASITPTVATFLKLPGGDFLVKTAATDSFAGGPQAQGQVVAQQEAAEAIGQENAQSMQPGQSATAVANPAEQMPQEEMNDKVVEEFGQWIVQDQMGNKLTGWVFPKTLAWDGSFTPQPIALFTNGSAYAFQDQIAGELAGKSTTLPSDPPRGDGFFYCTQGGKALATQPLMIGSSAAGPDGLPKFIGTDAFGQQVQVGLMDGLKEPARVSDVEYALPDHWKFMRLNNQTQLVSDPVQMNKAASVRAEANSVELLYNGSYHLRGACGLNKIAAEFRYDLDPVSAEFMLGVLGVDGTATKTKLAEARKKGVVKIAGLHTITTLGERYSEKVKEASATLANYPDLRVDLIKEAAEMDDASSVNNVLSLNFINPENLHMFINYIPELEMTSERLAEMWLYSVMGMNELPEDHLERAMKNMENVITGLKAIAHSEA